MKELTKGFRIESGSDQHGRIVFSLYKTGSFYNNTFVEYSRPEFLKSFYLEPDQTIESIEGELSREIMLNDWSRWNTELPKGQEVEISEAIYYHLLEALPPHKWQGSYFEVGEPHHHENGRAIYRACWMNDGKYFTGYPKS